MVLLTDTGTTAAADVAERILTTLSAPVRVGDHELTTNASIGLAAGAPGLSDAEVLRHADVAMYAAKARGKDGWVGYVPQLDGHTSRQAELGAALRNGLDRGEFSVAYQPIVTLPGGALHSVEALLRWHPTGRDPVPAAAFITVAERSGLIMPLGRWVLREACGQAAEAHRTGRPLISHPWIRGFDCLAAGRTGRPGCAAVSEREGQDR